METYHITFHMSNEKKLTIQLQEEPSFDFASELRNSKTKWYQCDNKIINLDNVEHIVVDTETERKIERKKQSEMLNNINF